MTYIACILSLFLKLLFFVIFIFCSFKYLDKKIKLTIQNENKDIRENLLNLQEKLNDLQEKLNKN